MTIVSLIVQKWSGWKSKLEGRHISACKIFSTPTLCYPGMMAIEDTEHLADSTMTQWSGPVDIEDMALGPNILAHGHRRHGTKAKQNLGSLAIEDMAHHQQAQALRPSRTWHIGQTMKQKRVEERGGGGGGEK